ncbi:MAG: AAA family ATPase [Gammaproteobacteria bacterium]
MTSTITIANQKGGCGKTTTAINLAACLGRKGQRALLIDMDPQGHASLGLGRETADTPGLYEVFVQDAALQDVILPEVTSGVDLVPATISLAAVEHLLADLPQRERQLREQLATMEAHYDFIIIDSPPNLGLLSFNALRAADRVLIPLEMSLFSLDGIQQLQETIQLLAEKYQLSLPFMILPTLVDYRTRFTRDILEEIRQRHPEELLPVSIHYTIRLKEAAWRGLPIIDHQPRSPAADDYRQLTEILLETAAKPVFTAELNRLERHITEDLKRPIFPEADDSQARRIVFTFPDNGADIRIAGDFNDWEPDRDVQTRCADGAISKIIYARPGVYQYRLVVDGRWQADPTNPRQIANLYGEINSILRVEEAQEASPV